MARVGVAGDSSSVALPSQDASAVDRRQMIYSLGIAGSAPNMNKHQGPSFFLAPDKTCARVAKVRTSIELFLTEVSANKRDPGLQQEVWEGEGLLFALPLRVYPAAAFLPKSRIGQTGQLNFPLLKPNVGAKCDKTRPHPFN